MTIQCRSSRGAPVALTDTVVEPKVNWLAKSDFALAATVTRYVASARSFARSVWAMTDPTWLVILAQSFRRFGTIRIAPNSI